MLSGSGSRRPQKPPIGSTIDGSGPLAQGLQGLWALNEGTGGTAYGAAGGAPLALGTTVSWVPGAVGWALATDGATTGAMTAALPAGISATAPWSLLVRCRRTDGGTGLANILNLGTGSANLVICDYYATSNGLIVTRATNGITDSTYLTGPAIDQSQWHDILLAWDGSSNACRVYVDGVDRTAAASNYLGVSTAAGLTIAGRVGTASPAMQIDRVGLWSRALSAAEAAMLASSANAIFPLIYRPRYEATRLWQAGPGGISYRGRSILRPAALTTADILPSYRG
jgi:hypothetical protein